MLNALILSSVLLAAPRPEAPPHHYRILLIGAGKYPQFPGQDLSAAKDVERVHDFFRERLGVPEDEIKVVNDSSKMDRDSILGEVRNWLVAGAKPGNVVVLWWGGHGLAIPTGSGPETIGAIVPPKLRKLATGEIDSDSLILTRELRVEFSRLPAGVTDATIFLDCCYSGAADRSAGQTRELVAKVTKPNPERLALPPLGDPKEFVYVSAGNQFQPVSEVQDEDGQSMGPLAYSLLKLGPRISAGITYRDFETLLNGVAMQTRSTREPEVRGAVNRPLFGGQIAAQSWNFPVFFPKQDPARAGQGKLSTYRKRFKAFSADVEYNPDLPFIPVGQLQGIRPGMRFLVTDGKGYKQELEAGLCFADFTQLKPLGSAAPPPTHDDLSARVVDSVGARVVKIGPADLATAQALDWDNQSKLVGNPLIAIIPPGKPSDYQFRYDTSSGYLEIVSKNGATVMLKPLKDVQMATADLIRCVAHGDLVRNLDMAGIPSFNVEIKLVPVTTNFTPSQRDKGEFQGSAMRATGLLAGEALKGRIGPDSVFCIAVRVRANPEAEKLETDHIPGQFFAKHSRVYILALAVDQDHSVKAVFPFRAPTDGSGESYAATPIQIERDQWSGWTYLGLRGRLLTEQQALADPAALRLVNPSPAFGKGGTESIKVIANEKDFDFSRLVSAGVRGADGSAAEDLLNQIMNGGEATADRGPADRLQDWGVATATYWLLSR